MTGPMVFVKTKQGQGSRMHGTLTWNNHSYDVVTGGYGKGPIPDGRYTIEVYKAVEGTSTTMKSGFVDPLTGKGWFLPLTPTFSTTRHGFGIHPDGNLPGTKGCVGIQGKDIQTFWQHWMQTSIKQRPKELVVSTQLATAGP